MYSAASSHSSTNPEIPRFSRIGLPEAAAAASGKPILLKRGISGLVEEWLLAAEYICVHGNNKVILCERGIRTFEHACRNTLDLSAVAVAKKETHLPVFVDPSP